MRLQHQPCARSWAELAPPSNLQRNQVVEIGYYRCIPRFPDQRAFSTESMDAGLEEQSPVECNVLCCLGFLQGLLVEFRRKKQSCNEDHEDAEEYRDQIHR